MITAKQKRAQQEAENKRLATESARLASEFKRYEPARLKAQRTKALQQLEEEIAKASGQVCETILWELDRRIENNIVIYLTKRGYQVMRQYTSVPETAYGFDGETHDTGRTESGTVFTIRW